MFFDFNFTNMSIEDYVLEIKTGNNIQRQRLQAPPEIAETQFKALCQEVFNANQPIRVKISRIEQVWNQFKNEYKPLEVSAQIANKHYMDAFPDEFKDGDNNEN